MDSPTKKGNCLKLTHQKKRIQTTVEHNLNQFDFSHQHNHCFSLTLSIRMLWYAMYVFGSATANHCSWKSTATILYKGKIRGQNIRSPNRFEFEHNIDCKNTGLPDYFMYESAKVATTQLHFEPTKPRLSQSSKRERWFHWLCVHHCFKYYLSLTDPHSETKMFVNILTQFLTFTTIYI